MHDPIQILFQRLSHYGLDHVALTGSFATKLHLAAPFHRKVNDIDLVVTALNDVPAAWNEDLLCLHVHPDATPGNLLVQFIDPDTSIPIDIFREHGTAMTRTERHAVDTCKTRLVAVEDLVSHDVRRLLDLGRGKTVPGKHAADFKNLRNFVDRDLAELIWPEYRGPEDPGPFADAVRRTRNLLDRHRSQLVASRPHWRADGACQACRDTARFQRVIGPKRVVTAKRA